MHIGGSAGWWNRSYLRRQYRRKANRGRRYLANVRIHFDDAQDLTLERHRIYRLPNGPVTVDLYEELSSVFELLVVYSAHHWRLQYSSRRSSQ